MLPRLVRAAAALALVVVAAALGFVELGARLLVRAPHGEHVDGNAAPPEVSRALRVPVDGATLDVWLVDPASPPRATVFLLHGIGDDKRSFLGWARALAARGLRAVLVDSRGHGRSSGARLGYGTLESRDLGRVLDALERDGLRGGPVAAIGVSYGAATAVLWGARDARVGPVVAVAPFAALDEIVPRYLARLAPRLAAVVPAALVGAAVRRGAHLAGFDPAAARPVDAAARLHGPLLVVHGRGDAHIPSDHGARIAAAAHGRLLLLDADHETIGGHPEVLPAALAHVEQAIARF